MKKFILIAVITIASYSGYSQDDAAGSAFKFGVGLTVGFPASNMDGISVIVGGDLMGQYSVSDKFAITADAGYQRLMAKGEGEDGGLVPIRAGIRFFPSTNLYLGAKIGVGLLTGGDESVTTTAYSFGAGYMMSPKLDIGVSYDGYSKSGSFGLIGIRLGYFFN